MIDELIVAARLALYVDLMLLFGLPLFALYGQRETELLPSPETSPRSVLAMLATIAILLSCLGLAVACAAMAGMPIMGLDSATVQMVITQTPIGTAWLVRMAALLVTLVLIGVFISKSRVKALTALSLTTGIALATLAWGGHGAASEGVVGTGHLIADIVHLLAAGAWLGALTVLGSMLFGSTEKMTDDHLRLTHRALEGFSVAGTIIVALVIVSGLVNSYMLIGPQHILSLPASLYGKLFVIKMALFGLMLALAAINRFRLTPALRQSIACSEPSIALAMLRRSLMFELSAAIAILGIVAWLGTLEPPMSM